MKEDTSNQQRKCSINSDVGCEDCKREMCPYVYCQKIDCMACESRAECPMCEGDCRRCRKYTYCVVFNAES